MTQQSVPLDEDDDLDFGSHFKPAPGLLDLSRQRNILLLRPVFQLERSKGQLADDEGSLFEGIDTHYLVLAALDHMMEATLISRGSTAPEVLEYLAEVTARMRPELSEAQRHRIASVVLDALDNKANKNREFTADYFDAPSRSTKTFRFRLVRFESDPADVYRYTPTSEGYLVYLGMLDLSPEDSQELMEKMLELLVLRGRFDEALNIAKRARKLSLGYRQVIRDKLYQAYRAPATVNWSRDMEGRLDSARVHVKQRQAEDVRMEQAVRDALDEADQLVTREHLVQLIETLRGAGLIRMKLVSDINASPELFITAQKAVFRARKPTGLPDLETRIFPDVMSLSSATLAKDADSFVSALYPTEWPKVYDLNSVLSLLMEKRAEDAPQEEDDGELTEFIPLPDQFPRQLVESTTQWLALKFDSNAAWRIDELLAQALTEGLPLAARRCMVFVLYRSFADTETEFRRMSARIAGGQFTADVARGDSIEFIPQGEVQ
jgi:hypothetical protein